MARVLLLVKLLAAATTISAELSDPCAQAFKEHSNAAGEIFFKAPLDAAVECFRNVSIDSDLRFVTHDLLSNQIGNLYGFLPIALDSSQSATPQSLAEPFTNKFVVYPSNVTAKLEAFHKARDASNAWDAFEPITDLVTAFNDAHTSFSSAFSALGFFYSFPFQLGTSLNSGGNQVAVITVLNNGIAPFSYFIGEQEKATQYARFVGWTIVSASSAAHGRETGLEYMIRVAGAQGLHHGPSQRLNSVLSSQGAFSFWGVGSAPRSFFDGDLKLTVQPPGGGSPPEEIDAPWIVVKQSSYRTSLPPPLKSADLSVVAPGSCNQDFVNKVKVYGEESMPRREANKALFSWFDKCNIDSPAGRQLASSETDSLPATVDLLQQRNEGTRHLAASSLRLMFPDVNAIKLSLAETMTFCTNTSTSDAGAFECLLQQQLQHKAIPWLQDKDTIAKVGEGFKKHNPYPLAELMQTHGSGVLADAFWRNYMTVLSTSEAQPYELALVYLDEQATPKPTVVLKVPKFKVDVDMAHEFAMALKEAANLASEHSGGKLMIDLSQNGGGAPWAAGMLIYQLTGLQKYQICEWYDFRTNYGDMQSPLSYIADNFVNKPLPDLAKLTQAGLEAARAEASRLAQYTGSDGYFATFAECLGRLSLDMGADRRNDHYADCVSDSFETGTALPYAGWSPFGNGLPTNANFSYDREDISYYTKPVTVKRGGQEWTNTQKWKDLEGLGTVCGFYDSYKSLGLGSPVRIAPVVSHLVTEVAVITDGTCGSTCSNFASQLYLNNIATTITYGGIKGEPLDITSFNGGNVIHPFGEGLSFQTSFLLNQKLGNLVFNITGGLPNRDTAEPTPLLPLPYKGGSVSFAYNAQYIKSLGRNALPREWYRVPGSHHLDWWPANQADWATLKGSPMEPSAAMQTLYREANKKPSKCVYEAMGRGRVCGYVELPADLEGIPNIAAAEGTCSEGGSVGVVGASATVKLAGYSTSSFDAAAQAAVKQAIAIQTGVSSADAVRLTDIKNTQYQSRRRMVAADTGVVFTVVVTSAGGPEASAAKRSLDNLVSRPSQLDSQVRQSLTSSGLVVPAGFASSLSDVASEAKPGDKIKKPDGDGDGDGGSDATTIALATLTGIFGVTTLVLVVLLFVRVKAN